MNKIIITVRDRTVASVHSHEPVDVSVINDDVTPDGDAAYVAGLKYETRSMQKVYPRARKSPPKQ